MGQSLIKPKPHFNLAVAFFLALASFFAQAKEAYPFKVDTVQTGNIFQVIAKNQGPATISVKLIVTEANNITSSQEWPLYITVKAYSDLQIAQVFAKDKTRRSSFKFSYMFALGDFNARPDPAALYRMPYLAGRKFIIGQAPGGEITTHTTPDSKYAIDIPMPENTLIVAARSGKVIEVVSENSVGNEKQEFMDKANYISVLHDDGTIATYAHLTFGGVSVKRGQIVREGDLIGYAGSTGFSSGPHLHFAVTHTVRDKDRFVANSIPINFYVGNPAYVFQAKTGMEVRANYLSPERPH